MSTITNWADPAKIERFISSRVNQDILFWAAKTPRMLP
jgi:hypothetical protein